MQSHSPAGVISVSVGSLPLVLMPSVLPVRVAPKWALCHCAPRSPTVANTLGPNLTGRGRKLFAHVSPVDPLHQGS